MSLSPLLNASPIIQVHAMAAFAAALGCVQLALPNGNRRHRVLGFFWVGLMLLIAFSSLFIHTIKFWGPWQNNENHLRVGPDCHGLVHAVSGTDYVSSIFRFLIAVRTSAIPRK
jgi:uncharacterized membrane protein